MPMLIFSNSFTYPNLYAYEKSTNLGLRDPPKNKPSQLSGFCIFSVGVAGFEPFTSQK